MSEETKTEPALDIIDFRLTNIEKTLAELKDVMTTTKLQERDIHDLSENQDELLQAINCHDQRIKKLEVEPVQKKADRWQYILDYIFKAIVAGVIVYFLSKFNFPIA